MSRDSGIFPMNKLKLWILALPVIFALAQNSFGQEREYPNYNFAITPPGGWDVISNLPPQKGLLTIFGNAERTRLIVLVALNAKSTDGPLDDHYVANFEKGLQDSGGGKLISGKFIEVQGFRSYERVGSLVQGQKHFSTLTRLIPVREQVYSLEVMRTDGDATAAPEIQQSLASFRFLTPPKPPMSGAEAAGYRTGYVAGRLFRRLSIPIAVGILLILGVVKLISSIRDKNERRKRATPPPLPPQP